MIPLVFIHDGSQEYLKCAIDSAQKLNEAVYLLGTKTNSTFCKNWFEMSAVMDERYEQFEKAYVHMSTNPYAFELACFKRYFVLLAFMKQQNFVKCIMVDSDILSFCDYSEMDFFREAEVAVSIPYIQGEYDFSVGPQIFCVSLEALEEFVVFLLDTYCNNLELLTLKDGYHKQNKIKGGICDMSLLYLWLYETKRKVQNLLDIDWILFDNSIQSADHKTASQFEMDSILQIKKLVDDISYLCVVECKAQKKIPVATLHFQGSAKSVMRDVYESRAKASLIVHRYGDYANRVLKKLRMLR